MVHPTAKRADSEHGRARTELFWHDVAVAVAVAVAVRTPFCRVRGRGMAGRMTHSG